MAQKFRALLDLCKRRGFLYQSAEIYGGLRGAYDYGPLGVELKKNIQQSWWRHHVYYRDDVVGLDTSIITPHPVLKASGHVDEFSDLLVDCMLTKERFRPDKAPELHITDSKVLVQAPDKSTAKLWQQHITEQLAPGIKTILDGKKIWLPLISFTSPSHGQPGSIVFAMNNNDTTSPLSLPYHGYVEPDSLSPFLTPSRPFNLMFKTFLDPIDPVERIIQTTQQHNNDNSQQTVREAVDQVLRPSTVYLRPETAQGVFINFEQVTRTMKLKPPFGIAQVGKSFRNEIRLEHGIFRTPEFEQMELEYFVSPWTASHWFNYWRKLRYDWWLTHACHPEDFRQRDHEKDEMAHYATGCTDVEFKYPWGWGEIEGVAHRGDYDLTQHMKNTGANFEVTTTAEDLPQEEEEEALDKNKNKKYVPHVIESSCGLNRAMLAYLCDAFHQVPDPDNDKLPPRNIMKLHPQLAPIKCAVMPLTGKPEFLPIVQKVAQSIRQRGWNTMVESQKLKIGKRYYRHDEIGTPWCVTVDYQSLEDDTVTIRDRDSGEQRRLPWKDVSRYMEQHLY
ncbi:glycyl-tRNA synthetase [Halteromyces radiatus]|uniref:glycyl-tRNA synthetase n=1 Tax=Halteromyces radiatus TaxID=101107 RepID=UPI00221F1FFD|nr:glycyl-tRNA synthetase [Halteromyces radiatus]KAI8089098.1 glycyl-tRNA synthetase [Halteromyces radiatus]